MCVQLDSPRHTEAVKLHIPDSFENQQVKSALRYRDMFVRQLRTPIEQRYEFAPIGNTLSI